MVRQLQNAEALRKTFKTSVHLTKSNLDKHSDMTGTLMKPIETDALLTKTLADMQMDR